MKAKVKIKKTFKIKLRNIIVISVDILFGKVNNGDSILFDDIPVEIKSIEFVDYTNEKRSELGLAIESNDENKEILKLLNENDCFEIRD